MLSQYILLSGVVQPVDVVQVVHPAAHRSKNIFSSLIPIDVEVDTRLTSKSEPVCWNTEKMNEAYCDVAQVLTLI